MQIHIHARENRVAKVVRSCYELSTAIEYDTLSPARDYCVDTTITYTVGLSALVDYADTLDPTVWPPVYPQEAELLYQIFTPYLNDTPKDYFESSF